MSIIRIIEGRCSFQILPSKSEGFFTWYADSPPIFKMLDSYKKSKFWWGRKLYSSGFFVPVLVFFILVMWLVLESLKVSMAFMVIFFIFAVSC